MAGLDSLLNLTAAANRPVPPAQPAKPGSPTDRGFSDRLHDAVQPRPDTEASRGSPHAEPGANASSTPSSSRLDSTSPSASTAPRDSASEPDRREVDPTSVPPAVAPLNAQASTPSQPTDSTTDEAVAQTPSPAVLPAPAVTQAAPQSLVDALSQTVFAESAAAPALDGAATGLSTLDPLATLTGTLVENLPSPPAAELPLSVATELTATATTALASDDASALTNLQTQTPQTSDAPESILPVPPIVPSLDSSASPQEQTPDQPDAAASMVSSQPNQQSLAQSPASAQSRPNDLGNQPVQSGLPVDLDVASASGPVDPTASSLVTNPASPSAAVSSTPATPPAIWLAALDTASKTTKAEPDSSGIAPVPLDPAADLPIAASQPATAAAPQGLFAGLWVDAVVTPRGPAPAREDLPIGETWNDLLASDPFAAATPQASVPTTQDPAQTLDATRSTVATTGPESQSRHVTAHQVIDQVVPAVVASKQGGHEVRIRLNPPELGSLLVDIRVRDGVVSARLEATQPTTQQLVTDNLGLLRDGLAQQGLTVDRIEVTLAESPLGRDQTSSNRQGNQSSRDDAPVPYLDSPEQPPATPGQRAVPAPKFIRVNQGLDIQV